MPSPFFIKRECGAVLVIFAARGAIEKPPPAPAV
jgi:hypothetical protein